MALIFGNLKAPVFLILAMALWSSAFIAVKIALVGVSPFLLIFSRLVLGSVFFLAFWKFRGWAKVA